MTERKADLEARLAELEFEIALAVEQGVKLPIMWVASTTDGSGKVIVTTLSINELDRQGGGGDQQ